MHSEWRDRLDHWLRTLRDDFYLRLGSIDVSAFCTMDQLSLEEALVARFEPIAPGTPWGRAWEYCWMRGRVVLPEAAVGKRVVMNLNTGGETTVFVDGRSFGTYRAPWIQYPHHYIVDNCLTPGGEAGRAYDIVLEAYAGHFYPEAPTGGCATGPVLPGSYRDPGAEGERAVLGELSYGIWNEDAYQLYLDLETLRQLGDQVDPEGLRADRIAGALERATLIVDFEQPLEGRIASCRAAREALRPALEAVNGSTAPVFYAVGNAHIDMAWLWPMAETRRKTSRTFAAQLRQMEEYPGYRYLQSQPAAYEMCRQCYPELFERIRAAVKGGQWIAEGAMWVEPDTNMTSGESLIRQVVHGKRYFKETFGADSVMLWLPDTFGYSAALPQILKGTGVKYLVTQKIFWSYNEGDRFPYHYFTWRGADGSEVVSFLPTSYTYRTDPKEICETWNKRVQKRGLDAFLLPFGYGDGGGGPTRDHIEFLLREKDLEGMPRTRMESPLTFFEDMEAEGGPEHTYVGELYFSAHRGVYTSQAAIKWGNRKAELALREAELWGSLASAKGWAYPLARMDAAWKKLLLNQFHDILPGSSIARVYEDARRDHRWIISEADTVRDEALAALAAGEGVTVFNSLSFPVTGLVELPGAFARGALTDGGRPVAAQPANGGALALVTVPSCGAVSLVPAETEVEIPPVNARLTGDGAVIENDVVRAVLNARGEVISFVDRAAGREFAGGPMNRLLAFKDVPRLFDAWDIDSNYELQQVDLPEPVELTVKEAGGLRAVIHLSRRIMNSAFEQDIVLEAGSRRLDFVTEVEWRELHRLLKVAFPVAVEASEGINEIQFGYMKRPNHRSRLYDSDRFEVCNQRYSALCDESHGAAVLNDCKYGISLNGNAMRLTLLRAAASPEMRADNGSHRFTYAFTAWEGGFLESPVVREAYRLNVPLRVARGSLSGFSAFEVDAANIFIDTVKPAEDGSGDIVLRLYEAKRADTRCRLRISVPAVRAWLCDMLENRLEALPIEAGQISLAFHTFEVKTLRLEIGKN
ncbi:MAG: glycoside hydrolase family 38 C-terminal domain-containing protein [Clostridia bacterium]|nr:glycoside hydrolase family 38 C-terminal domain-containing protein [Clostridia bacterium]